MHLPGGAHLLRPTNRQDVGGSVGDVDAGACSRELHHLLRVVGGRMVGRLVLGRDLQGGAVVVGPVVQRRHPVVAGVDGRSDWRSAVGAEDELGCLDLDLEAERTRRESVGGLQGPAHVDHGRHLADRAHLGEGEDESGRQGAQPVQQAREEQVQGAYAAAAGRFLEALEPDADECGCDCVGHRGGDGRRGCVTVGVLRLLPPVPVAVLEVQTQVLDRARRELVGDPVGDLRGDLLAEAEAGAHGSHTAVCLDEGEGRAPPLLGQVRGVAVRGHVDRVHGLAAAVLPGVCIGQERVGRRERLVDAVEDFVGEECTGHLRSPFRMPAG